jgi:hypothetical protein
VKDAGPKELRHSSHAPAWRASKQCTYTLGPYTYQDKKILDGQVMDCVMMIDLLMLPREFTSYDHGNLMKLSEVNWINELLTNSGAMIVEHTFWKIT